MNLRDKMLAVIQEVNTEVAEREELIELIAVALLTGNNLFILGKPGQAKSYSINQFRKRITDARQFERLLSKQTDEDQLFGRLDLSSLIPGAVPELYLQNDMTYQALQTDLECAMSDFSQNLSDDGAKEKLEQAAEKLEAYRKAIAGLHRSEPVVNTAGKIPEADICFLDEIFKCNDGVLNSLLTALNERKYTNEGHTYAIPTISFFAASNEIPNFADPQEKILEALYDRLQIKIVTEDIQERTARLAVLKDKQLGSRGTVSASITLDELKAMQQEVRSIPVPDTIHALADDVLCELRRGEIFVSDRKFLNYYPLAQAKAWLEGHSTVQPQDLLILKCYLWQKPGDRAVVESVLNRLCINPLQDKVNSVRASAQETVEDFNAARQNGQNSKAGSKALIKLRTELLRLYQTQQELSANAQSDAEKAMTDELLLDLEKINKEAHETAGFTYAPLEQLYALQ